MPYSLGAAGRAVFRLCSTTPGASGSLHSRQGVVSCQIQKTQAGHGWQPAADGRKRMQTSGRYCSPKAQSSSRARGATYSNTAMDSAHLPRLCRNSRRCTRSPTFKKSGKKLAIFSRSCARNESWTSDVFRTSRTDRGTNSPLSAALRVLLESRRVAEIGIGAEYRGVESCVPGSGSSRIAPCSPHWRGTTGALRSHSVDRRRASGRTVHKLDHLRDRTLRKAATRAAWGRVGTYPAELSAFPRGRG